MPSLTGYIGDATSATGSVNVDVRMDEDGFYGPSSFSVSFSAALSSLSNVGPGLGQVGPTSNFAMLSARSKLVMSLCMVIGRLEIFPVLVLFSRAAWRRT